MNKIVTVYCEGKSGSHDYEILAKVINSASEKSLQGTIQHQPIGSKKGAGSAIQVYENNPTQSNFYYFFRDRDFDIPVPESISLTKDRYILYSFRTTIENYLFDTSHFYQFICEQNLTHYQLTSERNVEDVFIKAAKKIAYYQAIRHTLGKMRIPTDFGTTWLGTSGTLPTEEELNNNELCFSKAWEKIEIEKKKTDVWTKVMFEQTLADFYCQFTDDTFYEGKGYLTWYQGKDFDKALQTLLPDFPMKAYYKFAKKHFDYTKFDDLVELHNILVKSLS